MVLVEDLIELTEQLERMCREVYSQYRSTCKEGREVLGDAASLFDKSMDCLVESYKLWTLALQVRHSAQELVQKEQKLAPEHS